MAIGVVGDAYMHQRSLEELKRHRIRMDKTKEQGITGVKYKNGRELGEKVVFVNTLKRDIKIQKGFIEQNKSLVKLRLGEKERVIRAMMKEAQEFKESLVKFNDGTEKNPLPFLNAFKRHMKTIEVEGNTKVGDSYIFGGTITNKPPFNLSNIVDGLAPDGGVNTDYYEGNSITTPIAIDNNTDLDIDLLGNHPAFETMIRALKIASDPTISSGDDRISTSQKLIDEAINELSGLISQVGSEQERLDLLVESQEDRVLYMSEKYEEIVGIDEIEVITSFTQDLHTLDIAYQMMGRLGEISLSDYWK